MKIQSRYLAMVILLFIFGTVALTSALNMWKTTNSKIPATYKVGDFTGQFNPEDIRGSYSFTDINKSFGIPLEDLAIAFGVQDPAQYATFLVKNLETMYVPLAGQGIEIGTGSVRIFVALYKGFPITLDDGTYLPKPAADLLKAKASLTPEQIRFVEKNAVDIRDGTSPQELAVNDNLSQDAAAHTITGKTTFKELLDWRIRKEDIEKVLHHQMPDPVTLIRDYATSEGIEFSIIKGDLQKLADTVIGR